jgi:hypothetical protein
MNGTAELIGEHTPVQAAVPSSNKSLFGNFKCTNASSIASESGRRSVSPGVSHRSLSTSPEPLNSPPGRRKRRSKRGRSKTPKKFPENPDPSRIHSDKVVQQVLDSVSMPHFDDPRQTQVFLGYKYGLYDAIKKLYEPKTGWELLQRESFAFEPQGLGTNTNYRNTVVRLQDLRCWDSFPTFEDIERFSKCTAILKRNFHDILLPVIADDQSWFDRFFKTPSNALALTEANVIETIQPFFAQLNHLIRLATHEEDKKTCWVMIGSSKCAMKRREGGRPERKDPDRAAFWTDGVHAICAPDMKDAMVAATDIPCLLVGDNKMAGKFSQKMLLRVSENLYKTETQKVVNQIHDYMDMHHNRFGYIITETEVVMFRRRDENQKWGQLDFSPAIPLKAKEGNLNALMVLWYFHVKYAVLKQDETYELHSFYDNCPIALGGSHYSNAIKSTSVSDGSEKSPDGETDGQTPKKSRKKKMWK